jgi:hypothetical protein
VSRLEAQKSDIERVLRNSDEIQQKLDILNLRFSEQPTIAIERELKRLQQDPLYVASTVSYEKEKENVVKTLQLTTASMKQSSSTELSFEVTWSSVFYTTRFDLTFESTYANVKAPQVTMCISMYMDDLCLGTYNINESTTNYELVCTAPFFAKRAIVKCSNLKAANWRIVSVLPQVLPGSYVHDRPIRLWGETRDDARCMLLQTSPVELEIPVDMCPVHTDQTVNTFPVFCPHKPTINSYLWFLDSSASWMLVPYKRNISHIDDKASSILQIGMYLT